MSPKPLVHVELRTGDPLGACAFLTQLLGWRTETVHIAGGRYLALDFGGTIEGGVVEDEAIPALWLPYIEVPDIAAVTARARTLGAAVLLAPREGPAGWRSRISHPSAGDVAFWQPKS
jgi:predicted enzyme related to lactoylglutathione lyase